MWAGTNFDYETEAVSNVYGPFKSQEQAVEVIRRYAESEFEDLKAKWPDARLTDTLDDDVDQPGIEITFDDDHEDGCFYQVLAMEQ
jgi:hypothetical protein